MEDNAQPFPSAEWEPFTKIFGPGFPFNQAGSWTNPEFVNRFVRDTYERALSRIESKVYETRRYVHVKLNLPSYVKPENIRVFAGFQSVSVRGKELADPVNVQLPSAVNRRQYKAVYKNGLLHIQLRKSNLETERELFIEY